MKAWQITQYGEPKVALKKTEKDQPITPPGHVRFNVHAAALALPDVFMCRGSYAFKPELPFTPGQEFVGEVIECGEGVSEFKSGDRIAGVSSFFTGDGAFAEQSIAMESTVYPISDAISNDQAAAFVITYHTAYTGLVLRGNLAAGETLLVSGGAGGVGSAAIQLAKALGARVIATATGEGKAEICRKLGADEVVDLQQQSCVDSVMKLTDGRGANIIYDAVGGEFYENAFNCMAHQGRMLAIGFASGRWGNTPLGTLVAKNLSVIGALPSGFQRQTTLDYHRQLLALLAEGKISCLIDQTISFDEIPEGLKRIEDRKSVGRIIMQNA
jgi:NADPH2:quinone reductase